MKNFEAPLLRSPLRRRDFIKLGAGAGATVTLLNACGSSQSGTSAEQAQQNPPPAADAVHAKEDPVQRVLPKFKWGEITPGGNGGNGGGGGVQGPSDYRFGFFLPPDVQLFNIGLGLEEYDTEGVDKASRTYAGKADLLAKAGVNLIFLGGAPVSAQLGRDRIQQMLADTTRRTGVRADATLEANLAGMARLGVKTITVGSRWGGQLNQAVTAYCKKGGVEVLGMTNRDWTLRERPHMTFEETMRLELELAYEAVKKAPKAAGLLLPGGVMAEHVIDPIEKEFGISVFTNMNCKVWNNLVRPKVIPAIQGWGRLLATP